MSKASKQYINMLGNTEAAEYRASRCMWPEEGDELLINGIAYTNVRNPTWEEGECNIPHARVSKWESVNGDRHMLVDIFELDRIMYDQELDHAMYIKNDSMRMVHELRRKAGYTT